MAPNLAWNRLGALSGLLFAVLVFAGMVIGDPNRGGAQTPNPTQPSAEIARALVAHRDNLRLGSYVGLVGVFFLFWFLAYLRHHLERAAGDAGWLPAVAYGGGLVAAGMLLMAFSYAVAGSVAAEDAGDTQVAKALFVLGWDHLAVVAPPLAALVGGTAAASLRSAALPAWLAWFGVLVTVLLLSPIFFFGFLAFFGWVIAVSIVLLLTGNVRT